ncbi:MAG TPA: stage III sporulation protein AB [Firmicutes bacterium]|nr:stage III sporulation protein AB [Bacillota bacterium]
MGAGIGGTGRGFKSEVGTRYVGRGVGWSHPRAPTCASSTFGGHKMKMIGALLVMTASTFAGWIYSTLLKKRLTLLNALIQSFQWLETEIGYASTPLVEAFTRISGRTQEDVQLIFSNFVEALQDPAGLTADEAWQHCIKQNQETLPLKAEDWALLFDFGRTLGTTDREHQVTAIRQTLERLQLQTTGATEERKKNERLYRYLGVAGGALVVLIFY